LTLLVGRHEGHPACKKIGGWWRWALVSLNGVVPSRMVGMSASVNLPLHQKVQKFSSGTGSHGWSRKKGRKTVLMVVAGSKYCNEHVYIINKVWGYFMTVPGRGTKYCNECVHMYVSLHNSTRRPASADRTARCQFQATGQPLSRSQTSEAIMSRLPHYEVKCVQRSCFQWGSVPLRSDIKGTERPPANILIPLERQLLALQHCH